MQTTGQIKNATINSLYANNEILLELNTFLHISLTIHLRMTHIFQLTVSSLQVIDEFEYGGSCGGDPKNNFSL